MIIFFGPAGAGKSLQGQMLAARHGWRWLSTGQLLRDARNSEVNKYLQEGKLVPDEMMSDVIRTAIEKTGGIEKIVLDGFPRNLNQAKQLLSDGGFCGRKIDLVIVLEISREEVMKRLQLRGRADDIEETIDVRLEIYHKEIDPMLDFFNDQNVPVAHIDGVGKVGQIHDAIEQELVNRQIVEASA